MIDAIALNLLIFLFKIRLLNNLTKLQISIVMRHLIENLREEEEHTMADVKYTKL